MYKRNIQASDTNVSIVQKVTLTMLANTNTRIGTDHWHMFVKYVSRNFSLKKI